ncbi:hypothetical protein OG394_36565 [Kribbella sp. NBC_01245]|uniref:hypothetical protein n=1 Tax=Kribbella sp. NBC_01245 TaxID=2903578 RepID=UPI002E2939F9|nr:hypothetical protein [Kribbella sp. NBC_01245]
MGIFSRKPKVDVVVDRSWDDPELDSAFQATRDGDLEAGRALLKATPQCTDLRCLRVTGLGRAAVGHGEQLETQLMESPQDPDLLLWLAQTKVFEAWAARRRPIAEAATFRTLLESARLILWDAVEAAQDDSAPWAVLQSVALGLEVPLEDKQYVFNQGLVRQPDCYAVHAGRVQVLAPRSGGSLDDLIRFGQEAANRAKPGRALNAINALVQAELNADPQGQHKVDQFKPAVLAARAAWLQPDRQAEPYDLEAHSAFAYVLRLYREPELAMEHVDAMQGRITTQPWGYEGDESVVFSEAFAKGMRV